MKIFIALRLCASAVKEKSHEASHRKRTSDGPPAGRGTKEEGARWFIITARRAAEKSEAGWKSRRALSDEKATGLGATAHPVARDSAGFPCPSPPAPAENERSLCRLPKPRAPALLTA
jgi:hypothetical protein